MLDSTAPLSVSASEELRFFLQAIRQFALLYPARLPGLIAPGDVIEIFDAEGGQRYRSFNFFEHCNYSVDELAGHPWHELYEREAAVNQTLKNAFAELLDGRKSFVDTAALLPEYRVRESLSHEQASFWVQERFLCKCASTLTGQSFVVSAKRVRPSA